MSGYFALKEVVSGTANSCFIAGCCHLAETVDTGYTEWRRKKWTTGAVCEHNGWPWVQFNCSSCVEQFANGSAVFWVTGHFLTPPENWTVRAFLQLTPRLSNDFTAAWLTFTFPQLFAVAATLKSIGDYNVAMTFILNNNNNNNNNNLRKLLLSNGFVFVERRCQR